MLDLIASILVRGLNLVFRLMPMRAVLWLGRRAGSVLCMASGRRKGITYANLKAAFGGEKTPEELNIIAKDVYSNVAQTFAELISMTRVDKKYIDKYVKVINMERIEKAATHPGGMILLSAHFGNWELSTVTSAMKGFPIHMLARDQKMERLNDMFISLRESKGNIVIRKGVDIKRIFKVLKGGGGIGLLADQSAGANGEILDFFGRPASTAVGPYRFAQKSGACILPAFMHRVDGPYHELVLEPIMNVDKGDDIAPFALEYNRLLEKNIRKNPGQWFWMHKRWKLTPVRKIMILDDGKKGHLNQSLAVFEQLKLYRENEGISPEHTELKIVKIKFRSRMAKIIFNALSPLFSKRCQGKLRWLKMALDPDSYEKAAVKSYADVIISCGSTLFGVNKMLKFENNARNIVILDPGRLNRGAFDMIVIPRHDISGKNIKPGKNMVVTEVAPNLVLYGRRSESAGEKESNIANEKRIGVLIGGDNTCFNFTVDLSASLVRGIKDVCDRIKGKCFITTSRRTPEEVDKVIGKAFENATECIKFVYGAKDKDPDTVRTILDSSDVIIVSGESVSMVSEAVSSGKPVIVFMPEKVKKGITKYERFARELEKNGYLRCSAVEDIPDAVAKVVEEGTQFKLPDDPRRILDNMYRLF